MPETLGETLKKFRESKELSLEEVSEKTRIPKKIISSIEEDRLSELSSDFYVKGFVKSYSHFLGADKEKEVLDYLSDSQKKEKEEPVLAPKREKASKKQIGIYVLIIFSAGLLFLGLLQVKKFTPRQKAPPVKAGMNGAGSGFAQANPAIKDATAVKPWSFTGYLLSKMPKAKHQASQVDKQSQHLSSSNVELEVEARENTWMEVISDGKLLFRGILEKGVRDKWKAKGEIKLSLGNAGGVALKLNGKNIGFLGKKGEKKEIVITKTGIKSQGEGKEL